jgi:glutathione S-transferase
LLTTQDHLCAGRFTAADISVGYALMLAEHLGLGDRLPPAVRAYGQRLQARPGHQRALAAQVAAATAQGVSTLPAPDLRP